MTVKASRWVVATLLAWAGACASAHEFWMLPGSFVLAQPAPVSLGLFFGVQFQGVRSVFNRSVVARLAEVSASGTVELTGAVPEAIVGDFSFVPARTGTHMVVMDSHPSRIDLPADTFTAYLKDEGLDNALAAREAAGTQAEPGRERFRRHVKTLLQVGKASDENLSLTSGQTFEIVPQRNPALAHAGEEMAFQVFFDGDPAEGVLVKCWQRQGDATVVSKARTDGAGTVRFTFPTPGTWMVSAVRMRPVADGTPGIDWDSHWANLTFRMPR